MDREQRLLGRRDGRDAREQAAQRAALHELVRLRGQHGLGDVRAAQREVPARDLHRRGRRVVGEDTGRVRVAQHDAAILNVRRTCRCGKLPNAAASEAEFCTVRDSLQVSDSVLSKHIAALEDVGYVKRRKGVHRGRRTTWISLSPRGREALSAHVAALRALISGVD